jgi:4'-phosphopantetheinyl transferase EntD
MPKYSPIVGLASLAFVAACATGPIEPVVASFNEASVGIQIDGNMYEFSSAEVKQQAIASADQKAADICRRGPNRRAEFVSSRNMATGQYSYVIERLYLCLR